ncbi:hypothetical protein [Porphyromonas pogonae]|uniref:hypothetical protein n=1 Tax=Porphyromonas pogonae TaxID=867595 RepID=UPI002E7972AB|nr:hypothetical protein [Porphyromonas pogonae]
MNSKCLLFLIMFLTSLYSVSAQNLFITGRLKSTKGEHIGIAQIPIRLISLDESKRTDIQITDSLGNFKFSVVQGRSYELFIATVAIETIKLNLNHIRETLNLGEIIVKTRTSILEEVVIEAPFSSTTHIDKQVLYPTTPQLKGASNAIDVLGNMMIQGLYIDPSQNRISTSRQGKLLVRINGTPASQKDYLRIAPYQIKRVEYHDFPSMRYGDAEAVIDIILKEPIHGIAVTWDSRNTFHTLWGDIYGDMSYNWRKSELGVSVSGTVHQYAKSYSEGKEYYRFPSDKIISREIRGIPSSFKEDYATVTLHYNYTDLDKTFFLMKVSYDYWKEKSNERVMMLERMNDVQRPITLSNNQERRYRELKPSFDLYYQRLFNKNIFAVNIVGNAFTSSSSNKLRERYEEHLRNEISTAVDGSRYSVIGDVFWQTSLKSGQLITGINYSMGTNRNELTNTTTLAREIELKNYNTYTYAQWKGVYNKLVYSLGLGYTLYIQKQEHTALNRSHFITPQLNLSLLLSRSLQVRYSGSVRVQKFSTGESNMIEYPVSSYVIHRGNPSLKPYNQFINQLGFTYSPKRYKLSLSLFDSYASGSIMESYKGEGDKIIRQLINADKYHQFHINFGLSSSLLDSKLNVGVGCGLRLMQTKSQTYNHKRTAFSYDTSISYNHKNLKYWANYRSDQANLNGESFYRGNGLINIGIDYRKHNYKIGLGYMTNASRFTSKKEYLADSYNTSIRSFNDSFRNTFYLSLSISLHSGKRFEASDRYIYNSDSDSGTLK